MTSEQTPDQPTTPVENPSWPARLAQWPAWRLFLIALAVGLTASLLWQYLHRAKTDFFTAATEQATTDDGSAVILPAPVSPGNDSGILGIQLPSVAERARRDEQRIKPVSPSTDQSALADSNANPNQPVELSVPVAVFSPAPQYPIEALRSGEEGTVLVLVTVDAAGLPSDLVIEKGSGSRALDHAALAALRRWRFQPALRQGVPVGGALKIPVNFKTDR